MYTFLQISHIYSYIYVSGLPCNKISQSASGVYMSVDGNCFILVNFRIPINIVRNQGTYISYSIVGN